MGCLQDGMVGVGIIGKIVSDRVMERQLSEFKGAWRDADQHHVTSGARSFKEGMGDLRI